MQRWHAEYAWLGHLARDVMIETEDERIASVQEGAPVTWTATRLPGLTIPGLANAHSHAFHRALRGHGAAAGDFWTWRDEMYRVAARLDPDTYYWLARAVYGEMALAGVTAVGEFHYVHHDRGGRPYADPNEMGRSLIRAAGEAGIRITLLDTCYLRGDFDQPVEGVQERFSDGSADAWGERLDRLTPSETVRIGAAAHSVRALEEASIATVTSWARARAAPLHVHVSEQPAENERCLASTGLTPTGLLDRAGVWEAKATAVHATHLTDLDIDLLGESPTRVCLCPTTERDLGDGIGPAGRLAAAGAELCVGSDSHAVVDLFEEARLVELHERLATGRRGLFAADSLLALATAQGMGSLDWDAGRLEAGALADFVTVRLDGVRLAGTAVDDLLPSVVFAATAADVRTVVVGGRIVVDDGRHLVLGDIGRQLAAALALLRGD
jgi:formiminoglutamate deiminase